MPEPDIREQVIQVACIHLSAAWDDMSLADAEENWRRGLGYGAVGSDGHAEIVGVAAGLADAIHALYAARIAQVEAERDAAFRLHASEDEILELARQHARAKAAEAQVEALRTALEEVRAELVYMQNGEKVKPYRLINTIDAALAPYPVPGSAQWNALETRALSAPADLGPSICEWQTRAPTEESSVEAPDFAGMVKEIGGADRQPTLGKHQAINRNHLARIITALDEKHMEVAADTLIWACWWIETKANTADWLAKELAEARSSSPARDEHGVTLASEPAPDAEEYPEADVIIPASLFRDMHAAYVAAGSPPARAESSAEAPADEFAYWLEIVRDWSGSAFLAGEKVEDEAALKSALYSDLCRLGNYLMAWRDDAAPEEARSPTLWRNCTICGARWLATDQALPCPECP